MSTKSAWVAAAAAIFLLAPGGARAGGGPASDAGLPSSDAWGRVVKAHVVDGGVDYESLASERGDLDEFLGMVANARPTLAGPGEAAAFWINAYNAVVVYFVLERYPEIDSVMDVAGFFDTLTVQVAGERLTLDRLEDRALAFGDPRAHFALVCAAVSCPALRAEPYSGDKLEAQLADQARSFLADSEKGARLGPESGTLWLSQLFNWYEGDFTGPGTASASADRSGLVNWVVPYLPKDMAIAVREHLPVINFLDYDWRLNGR